MAGTKSFPQEAIISTYLALALLQLMARFLGELARKLGQPAIIGEIISGVILGKTILWRVWPALWAFMFGPNQLGTTAVAAMASIASTLFMLVAGLEMDLTQILARKHRPIVVGFFSVLVPFLIGFFVAFGAPAVLGARPDQDPAVYAMFVGTACGITAMPVVAKTLRDVGLFRSALGQVVMSSATVDDLIGWSLFAIVLSLSTTDNGIPGIGVGPTIVIDIIFVLFVVIFGRLAFPRFFLWIQAKFSFPGGIIGFVIGWTFAVASFATYIGLHNTLGAFLVGASLSNNKYLRSSTREIIDHFVTYGLAPMFFGYIAVGADFIGDFNASIVFIVLTVAMAGKLIGASIGAKLAGSPWRESFAVAVCMNSRGAMEILLANVALAQGVIGNQMFVALVFMAIVTSLLPGPILRCILRRKQRQTFTVYMPRQGGFIRRLEGDSSEAVLQELCKSIGHPELAQPLVQQEQSEPSGNHDQLALVRMHWPTLTKPVIGMGLAPMGVDFSGQFGYPGEHPHYASIIVVCLFPERSNDATLEDDIVQQVCLAFSRQPFRTSFMKATNFMEIESMIKYEMHRLGLHSVQEEGLGMTANPGPQAVNPDDRSRGSQESYNSKSSGNSAGGVPAVATAASPASAVIVNNGGSGSPRPAQVAGEDRQDRQMAIV